MKRVAILFVPLLILAVAYLTSCSSERKVNASAPEVVHLSVITATTSSVPDLLEAVGTVRAFQTSQLASQATGTITQVRVREGDHVRRGEIFGAPRPIGPIRRARARHRNRSGGRK